MCSCAEAGAWTTRLPGPWCAVAKGLAEVFWMWHVLESLAAGGGGGALVLTHWPRAGMQMSQKQVWEGAGRILRLQEPYPGFLSPGEGEKGSLGTAQWDPFWGREAGELDHIPSPNMTFYIRIVRAGRDIASLLCSQGFL